MTGQWREDEMGRGGREREGKKKLRAVLHA